MRQSTVSFIHFSIEVETSEEVEGAQVGQQLTERCLSASITSWKGLAPLDHNPCFLSLRFISTLVYPNIEFMNG
jgi:hypothetical protein